MPLYEDPVDGRLIDAAELRAWTAALVERLATPADIAADVAEVLVAVDRRGISSHGTARVAAVRKACRGRHRRSSREAVP